MHTFPLAVALLVALSGAPLATAHAASASSLAGQVVDTCGEPLPGIRVQLRNFRHGQKNLAITDTDGRYSVRSLRPDQGNAWVMEFVDPAGKLAIAKAWPHPGRQNAVMVDVGVQQRDALATMQATSNAKPWIAPSAWGALRASAVPSGAGSLWPSAHPDVPQPNLPSCVARNWAQ
jgi:hypothetical protein